MPQDSPYTIKIFKTKETLNEAAAEFITSIVRDAIAKRGRSIISLSGGETPKKLYALLAQPQYHKRLDWSKIFIFWTDERCMPLDDEENNAYQAIRILLNKVKIPASNIHRIPVNLLPEEAANAYEKTLGIFFNTEVPKFDLILLGLGADGHTASLFPETHVASEKVEGIRSLYLEEQSMFRVTMTAPLINQARAILFLVSGAKKAAIFKAVLSEPFQPNKYPAQLIQPKDGNLYWFVDEKTTALTNF
jgi:6-phosphogluconolactonase